MKPPRKDICLPVLTSSDFTKINLIFLVIFFSLAFVRNDKGKASFCFAISQSIVRIFSFSFKLSLICCFFFFCGQGPVIKINSNQRYATTAVSSSIIRVIAESGDSNVPLQVQYIQQNRSLDCILSSACTKHAQGGWGYI